MVLLASARKIPPPGVEPARAASISVQIRNARYTVRHKILVHGAERFARLLRYLTSHRRLAYPEPRL